MEPVFIDLTAENLAQEHLCCIIRSKKSHPGVEPGSFTEFEIVDLPQYGKRRTLPGAAFKTVKKPVIASQRARWRGNPFSKTFPIYPFFRKTGTFKRADSHSRFAASE